MKKFFGKVVCAAVAITAATTAVVGCSGRVTPSRVLRFDPAGYSVDTLAFPDGSQVVYRAYKDIYYVTNVEDSTYQKLSIFVPEGAKEDAPIFLRTYVGAFMAAPNREPSARDASGRALKEGLVLCVPGSRGSNSMVNGLISGTAPLGLCDLKAAVRYLKFNDKRIPGDSDRIITDGTSAGGAMSSLLGTSGNALEFDRYLKAMGAANADDDIFAAVCFCPIIDIDHSDIAYEWLYGFTNKGVRGLNDKLAAISDDLATYYPAYLNSLELKSIWNGEALTDSNYKEYVRSFIEACKPAEDTTWVGDWKLEDYLTMVVEGQALKTPPSFDQMGVGESVTPENRSFGLPDGTPLNFTPYHREVPAEVQARVDLYNPMNYLYGKFDSDVAEHWYIRHGARDRDTAFSVPINFATRLDNLGYDVDFSLAWGIPHRGDYDLDSVFAWIRSITE